MAVMEIYSPSGYGFDSDELNHLKTTVKDLTRVEVESGNTKTNIYFNSVIEIHKIFDTIHSINKGVLDGCWTNMRERHRRLQLFRCRSKTIFDQTVRLLCSKSAGNILGFSLPFCFSPFMLLSMSFQFETDYSLKQKVSLQDVCGKGCWDWRF